MSFIFHNGEITDTATSPNDQVRVTVPTLNSLGSRTFGPVGFRPRITAEGGVMLPVRGDKALLAVDTEGIPWIAEWNGVDTSNLTLDTIASIAASGGGAIFEQASEPTGVDPGTFWIDTDASPQRDRLPIISNLPTNPVDGDEVYLLASGSGAFVPLPIWHMRYRSDIIKWQWIGGEEHVRNPTGGSYTLGSAWQNLSGEYEWIIPRGGTYRITGGFGASGSSGTNPQVQLIWGLYNSSDVYQGSAAIIESLAAVNNVYYTAHGLVRHVVLASGGNKLRFMVTAPVVAGSASIVDVFVNIRPVRLDAN